VQYSLPRDQWHYDVTHWFQTALALVQASFIDVAIGPGPYGFGDLRSPSLNAQEEKLCTSQVCFKLYWLSSYSAPVLFVLTVTLENSQLRVHLL
jgi:hypothetical protein